MSVNSISSKLLVMIQCPKCGFSQPKDQYCARCGVDMVAYQPPPKPLYQRFIKSNFFHISLVVVVIVLVANLLIRKDKSDSGPRSLNFRSQFQFSSEKNKSNVAITEDPRANAASPPPPEMNANGNPSAKAEAPASAGAASLAPAEQADTTNAKNLTSTSESSAAARTTTESSAVGNSAMKLTISYYEMGPRYVGLMGEESRRTNQYNYYDGYEVGALSGFQKKLEGLKSAIPLLHRLSQDFTSSNPKEWFLGLESSNPENHIGFYHYVEGQWIDSNTARINFQITKSWREGAGTTAPVQKASYPMTVEIPRGGAFYIAGVLGPGASGKNSYQGEDYIASMPPFGILRSNKFRRGETQLVVVVELAK